MKYVSTRDRMRTYSGAEAIVKGISDDGGLIVPSSFPVLDDAKMDALLGMDYPERAASVLAEYLDEFSYDELLGYARKAYSRFDGDDPCPLVKVDDGLYMLELWHGPTYAFKDMALTLLPYLMVASKKKLGDGSRTLILVATSGDTGKAALEGFRDVEGTEIIVFYPADGVSVMQKRQMLTQQGENVHVAGIKGNFDDAQTAVKKVFTDPEVIEKLKAHGIEMSSANSINWGRLAPQIAYYISAYCDLVTSGEIERGDKVNFVVPTGNFGNILAGYYAYRMGLPVHKLIVASNANNILTDFFNTGSYDVKRKFYKTMSPSMDILVSSNLERLLFEVTGRGSTAGSSWTFPRWTSTCSRRAGRTRTKRRRPSTPSSTLRKGMCLIPTLRSRSASTTSTRTKRKTTLPQSSCPRRARTSSRATSTTPSPARMRRTRTKR